MTATDRMQRRRCRIGAITSEDLIFDLLAEHAEGLLGREIGRRTGVSAFFLPDILKRMISNGEIVGCRGEPGVGLTMITAVSSSLNVEKLPLDTTRFVLSFHSRVVVA